MLVFAGICGLDDEDRRFGGGLVVLAMMRRPQVAAPPVVPYHRVVFGLCWRRNLGS